MRFAIVFIVVVVLVTTATQTFAAEDDAELLQQLQLATTDREYVGPVIAVNERLASGPLNPTYADLIVTELADSLAREWVLNSSTTDKILAALRNSGRPLTDAAVESLFAALDHRAMLNRSSAIEMLGTLPANHPRRSQAVDAMSALLQSHEHQHTRTSAAIALKDLAQNAALPESAISILIDAAQNDDYVSVRIDAADALSYVALERARAESVTKSLVAELIKPTKVTSRSRGLSGFNFYPGRARDLLARKYKPPYPAHVIDLWISQADDSNYRDALEILRAAVLRDELSAGQHRQLLAAATAVYTHDQRIDIYATAFVGTTVAEVAEATQVLSVQSTTEDRLAAAHRLYSYYQADGVPANVADIAAAQVVGEPDPEVARALALLLHDAVDSDKRGKQLADGLIAHAGQSEAWRTILPLLSVEHLELLIVYAIEDDSLPADFRATVLRSFEGKAADGDALPPAVAVTLDTAARSSNDYQVSQAAGRALAAWGDGMPLKVKLTNRQNQSKALGYLFLFLLVVNAAACIAGFVSVLVMPLESKNRGTTALKRTGLIVGWLLLSLVVLTLAGIAFIGFLGHNSAPPPADTLKLNLPLYIATPIYGLVAWLAVRRARQSASSGGR